MYRGGNDSDYQRALLDPEAALDDALGAFNREEIPSVAYQTPPPNRDKPKLKNARSLIQLHKTEAPSALGERQADDSLEASLARVEPPDETAGSIGGALADIDDTTEILDLLGGADKPLPERDPQATKLLAESASAAQFVVASLGFAFRLDQEAQVAGLLRDNNKLLIQVCVQG